MDADLIKLVEHEVADLRTDLTNYSCEVETEREQLKNKLEDVEKRLQNEIKKLKTRVDNVEHIVKRVDTDFKGVKCDFKEFKEKVEQDVKEIREKMDNFCVSLGETNASSPNHFIGVPNRNTYFTGRKVELISTTLPFSRI